MDETSLRTINTALDEAKERHGVRTDSELAQRYGVNAMLIHRLRTMDEVGASARLLVRLLAEAQQHQVAA